MKPRLFVILSLLMVLSGLILSALPALSVSAQAQAPTPIPAASPFITTLTGVNRALVLRVREGPSTRSKRIFSLTRGQMVTVLGISDNRRWFKIKTQDGKTGWAFRFFIRLVGGHISNLATVQ